MATKFPPPPTAQTYNSPHQAPQKQFNNNNNNNKVQPPVPPSLKQARTSSSNQSQKEPVKCTIGKLEDIFIIGKVLGKGSFSTVKLGINKHTNEHVALKIIPASKYRSNPRTVENLKNEVKIMHKVQMFGHPVIMKLKGVFEDNDKIVMVLEYLSGGELFDRIVAKGHYSEKDAADHIKTITSGLHLLHSNNILHRDMKPENCVYATNQDDELKITDFGFATYYDPNEVMASRHLVGTPGYIAPEILLQYKYVPACDIWAVGVILYILLCGYPPFHGRTHNEIFSKIKRGAWNFHGRQWKNISVNAKDLVTKMLNQDYKKRITAEEVLQHPFVTMNTISGSSDNLVDALDSMKTFNAKRKFKAAALTCIARNRITQKVTETSSANGDNDIAQLLATSEFSTEELGRLKTAFIESSKDEEGYASGSLSMNKFIKVMSDLGYSELPLERMFKLFDTSGDNEIDYKEFLVGLAKFKATGEGMIKFCFELYDEDNSGALSMEEMAKVMFANQLGTSFESTATTAPTPTNPELQGTTNGHSASHSMGAERMDMSIDTESPIEYDEQRIAMSVDMDPVTYEMMEKVHEIFELLDEDGNGEISYDEFKKGIEENSELRDIFIKRPGFAKNTSFQIATKTK